MDNAEISPLASALWKSIAWVVGFALAALILGAIFTLGWNVGLVPAIIATGGTATNITLLQGTMFAVFIRFLFRLTK